MKILLAVFIGSGLGGLTRFLLSRWVDSWHNYHFPFGTFVVNVVACFALGFVIGLADHKQILSPTARLFLAVGFCGGFSTFSTFSSETLTLFQNGHNTSLILYTLGSIVRCSDIWRTFNCGTTMTKRRTTANSGFKKLAVTCLNEHLFFVSSALLADSFVLRNRQLLKPANRYASL